MLGACQVRRRRSDLAFPIALAASSAAHVAVLAVAPRHPVGGGSAVLPAETHRVRAGVERSEAVTLTWLGFEEPTPHEARPSEVEQAALSLAPPTEERPPAEAPAEGAAPEATETEPSPTEAAPTEPRAEVDSDSAGPPEEAPPDAAEPESAAELHGKRQEDARPVLDPALEGLFSLDPPGSEVSTLEDAPPIERPDRPVEPQGEASPPNDRGRPREAAAAPPEAGANEPIREREGIASEAEAPPTSRETPAEVRPGKPLAAQGLRIKTRVPASFTIPTRLLGAARRPVYAVSFDHRGVVRRVELVRSSGNPDVDAPWEQALYHWEAEGAPLGRLPRGEALDALPPGDPSRWATIYVELLSP